MFINLEARFQQIQGVAHEARLEALLRAVGCDFYEPGLLRTPTVAIVAIGGLPVTREDPLMIGGMPSSIELIRTAFTTMRGLGGFMSYLNPRDRSALEIAQVLNSNGHRSTAHACFVTVGVFGLSDAVEHEFDCQRDLVHLGRLTVARTTTQNAPPLVVHNPAQLPTARSIRQSVGALLAEETRTGPDALEAINSYWPKSSATLVLLSGSLRNFAKLVEQKTDEGKEREYRYLVTRIGETLLPFAPDLFETPE
jgi:hypothetical protein